MRLDKQIPGRSTRPVTLEGSQAANIRFSEVQPTDGEVKQWEEIRSAAQRLYGCTQERVNKDIRDVDVLVDHVLSSDYARLEAENAKLREAINDLIEYGSDWALSDGYKTQEHGAHCLCIACIRLTRWRHSRDSAIKLLSAGDEGKTNSSEWKGQEQ